MNSAYGSIGKVTLKLGFLSFVIVNLEPVYFNVNVDPMISLPSGILSESVLSFVGKLINVLSVQTVMVYEAKL